MHAWEQFLQLQEIELGPDTVNKWLRSLKMVRFDACNLYLEAKDSFQVLWFEEHIRRKTQMHLVNGNNKKIHIHLAIANESAKPKSRAKAKTAKDSKTSPFKLNFDDLDPHCTFDYFITSHSNSETFHLVSELSKKPLHSSASLDFMNPVYLHGPTGCGKTHLLMGLTHAFRSQGLRAMYVRAELFTDHVVSAIRAGEMSSFRQAYRNADVLLVDDVQVFSRKGATQEEFFHTFNTLHLDDKQIILSAHCPPQELQLIEPRLVSRFEWGIVLPLEILHEGERKTMLQTKTSALQFPLSPSVMDFLLESFTSTPKALIKSVEALALRLHADEPLAYQNLSVSAAKTLLADLLIEEQKSSLTFLKIVQAAADHYGIRTEDILGKSQTRECALPRQLAMHFCRAKLKLPFTKIGELFSRDHSTVMTSVKFVQKGLDNDVREIAGAWHAIHKKLTLV